MFYRSVNVIVVCNLEVMLVGFYCGGEGVPGSSVVVCVLAFGFALVGRGCLYLIYMGKRSDDKSVDVVHSQRDPMSNVSRDTSGDVGGIGGSRWLGT